MFCGFNKLDSCSYHFEITNIIKIFISVKNYSKVSEIKEFIGMLMLFSSFIRVGRADKLFWQRRKKCSLFSVSVTSFMNITSSHYQQNFS